VKIGSSSGKSSAICASNPETIIVRGRDLVTELMGSISFTDHAWLLIAGSLPSAGQRALFDAALVAIAEHGLVPSVAAARMTLAASPEALQGAVAAGLLGCGSVILGSAQAAGQLLAAMVADPAGIEAGARRLIAERRAARQAIPGFGHPLHKGADPRAAKLLAIAASHGLAGPHCAALDRTEALLPDLIGKPLKINISGAIPAVLLDAGYPLLALKGVPLLARTASLIAHLLEEQQAPVGFAMAHAASAAIAYSGNAPDGFVADEN
jgi:citrate synthase